MSSTDKKKLAMCFIKSMKRLLEVNYSTMTSISLLEIMMTSKTMFSSMSIRTKHSMEKRSTLHLKTWLW
jgi:hypothetical protein